MLLASTASGAPNTNSQGQSEVGEHPRYIVKFKDPISTDDEAFLKLSGAGIIHKLDIINSYAIRIPPGLLNALEKNPNIERIEVDGKAHALAPIGVPGKPPKVGISEVTTLATQSPPWGVSQIGANNAWGKSNGTGVKVAILDTGIDYNHPDLDGNYKGGWDFVNNDNDPIDDDGHGTHVAGTVASENNDFGVVGVAPEAYLYGVKVLDQNGEGYWSDVIAGIQWATNNDMQIISMSLGGLSGSPSLESALETAYNAGIVIVAAAGNWGNQFGPDNVDYPARYDSVIAVAATDSNNNRASFSSRGPDVEISAPGVNILSTYPGHAYATGSGTSMATPHVTGVVALLLKTLPSSTYDLDSDNTWDPAEVREVLKDTADDLGDPGRDILYGWGLIDANESVSTGLVDQSDEFLDDNLDPKWDFTDPSGNSSINLTEKPGYLTLRAVDTNDSQYPVGAYQHNILSDFVFTSKINISGFTAPNQDIGIGIGDESDGDIPSTYFKIFVRTKYDWSNWVEVRTSYRVNGGTVYGETSGYLPNPYNNEYWLRISRTGDYLFADYSIDGVVWVSMAGGGIYDNSYVTDGPVKVYLFADERLGSSVAGYFDYALIE
jgi:subtilisin family serine protease